MESEMHKEAAKLLKKKNACYVLITCQEPNDLGDMNVEMSYSGDECLAAFLIENAQMHLDDELNYKVAD